MIFLEFGTLATAEFKPWAPERCPKMASRRHEIPYTPLGLQMLKLTKPSNGVRSVLPGKRMIPSWPAILKDFRAKISMSLRTTQILQTPQSVVILTEFGKIWRVVWTDGRDFPKKLEPMWFGYSIGKWEDDSTFVVQTTGINESTWIDRAGRPHSSELRVEERYHRVNYGTMELTVIINDPKMYTRPWVALDKLRFRLQPANFHVTEMMCSPSELAEYNKFVGTPASNKDDAK